MLVFDDKTVWGVQRGGGKDHKQSYFVFATPRVEPSDDTALLPDFAERSGGRNTARDLWRRELTLRPRAMVRANEHLFIGAMPGKYDPNRPSAFGNVASGDQEGGLLHIVSCKDGEPLRRVQIESPPVWDGMAAARGKLYISFENGSIACLGEGNGRVTSRRSSLTREGDQ
jgi:hypothetical protein